jgi:hypothetical protein
MLVIEIRFVLIIIKDKLRLISLYLVNSLYQTHFRLHKIY